MKKINILIIVLLIVLSCEKNEQTILIIKEQYAPSHWKKEGLIKGNLYADGINKPLYKDLLTDNNRTIRITDLLEGTYQFVYYVKEYNDKYWPTPRDTIFQIKDGETKEIIIK